jgi:hypothetical protein
LYGTSPKGAAALKIFQRSTDYFKGEQIKWITKEVTLRTQYSKLQEPSALPLSPFDLVFIDRHNHEFVMDFLLNQENIKNTTLVLIDGIYTSKTARLLWKRVKELQQVTVTIDMFSCGAVFFRKEQAKQHFKIRI